MKGLVQTKESEVEMVARVRSLVARSPLLALSVGVVVGGLLGGAIGAASPNDQMSALQADLTGAQQDAADYRSQSLSLEGENALLTGQVSALELDVSQLQDEVESLKAQAPLPAFAGSGIGAAMNEIEGNDWEFDVTKKATSSAPPGTVLSQSPKPGTLMLPGDEVTLVVAKAPPPPPEPEPPVGGGSGGGGGAGAAGGSCTAGYSPCLPPASDYDCAGGSGDGPEYTGMVTVTGSDPYGLDSNGNGVGCE